MKKLLSFLKKQGLALLILGASYFGVKWVVDTYRPIGAMTVVEAQAMDMNEMKAPIGVFPVAADYVLERTVGGSETFSATVVALSDEDIIARIPGLVKEIHVYPGDRVRAGQLLATLEADEFDAKALAGMLSADAKRSQVDSARDNLRREQASLSKTEIDVAAYEAGVEAAKAELAAAENHVEHYVDEVKEIDAKRDEVSAELEYAKLDYGREKTLFEGGAISRDDLDKAKKRIDTAQAKIEQVDAQRMQIDHELGAREAKRDAASSMLKQADARLDGAKESVKVSRSMVSSASSNLTAKEQEASAARAAASATDALSSYTELRANDDGVVTERLVSPGTPVMPGKAVLRVKVDRELRIQADLPQRLSSAVRVGSVVRISNSGEMKDAKVTSVFPFIEGRTRTFRVEAVIANNDSGWQVGSYAEMEVFTTSPKRSLSIRNESVKTGSDGEHYVWVVFGEETPPDPDAIYTCTMHPEVQHKGPGICPECKMDLAPIDATGNVRAEKRAVETGASDAFYTAITDGLDEGELVTWAGDKEMFPGAAIQVVEWDDSGPVELPLGSGQMEDMDMGEEENDMDMGDSQTTMPEGHEDHVHSADDAFYCPMHPDVHDSEASTCPICKMDLVPMPDSKEKGTVIEGHEDHEHSSDDLYFCPMDPDVHKAEEGSCPICKMDLIPLKEGS